MTMPRVGRAYVWRPKRDTEQWKLLGIWGIWGRWILILSICGLKIDAFRLPRSSLMQSGMTVFTGVKRPFWWHGRIPWYMCLLNQILTTNRINRHIPFGHRKCLTFRSMSHGELVVLNSELTVLKWMDALITNSLFSWPELNLKRTPTAAVWVQASQAEKTISACHERDSATLVRDPAISEVDRSGSPKPGWFGMTVHHENTWLASGCGQTEVDMALVFLLRLVAGFSIFLLSLSSLSQSRLSSQTI